MCVCVCVCVTTHNCRLTHWNHKTEIRTCSDILLPALPVGSFEAPSSVLRKEADASTTLPAPEPVKRGRGRPPKNALAQLQPSNQGAVRDGPAGTLLRHVPVQFAWTLL